MAGTEPLALAVDDQGLHRHLLRQLIPALQLGQFDHEGEAAEIATGLLHGDRARAALLRELPEPTPDRLERAGRMGVGDAGLREEILWLRGRVQEGLEELGAAVSDQELRGRVDEFFDAFPGEGRDPGSRTESWLES